MEGKHFEEYKSRNCCHLKYLVGGILLCCNCSVRILIQFWQCIIYILVFLIWKNSVTNTFNDYFFSLSHLVLTGEKSKDRRKGTHPCYAWSLRVRPIHLLNYKYWYKISGLWNFGQNVWDIPRHVRQGNIGKESLW